MKLKVFRVPIGFHDAYVAATSRKAALKAWGSEADLFARGLAEEVTDPALCAAPLAAPGTVIRLSRGSAAEQIAALPKDTPKRKTAAKAPAEKAPPPPDRSRLDAAEAAVDAEERRQGAELRTIEAEIGRLAARRDRMIDRHREDLDRLRAARDRAAREFDRS